MIRIFLIVYSIELLFIGVYSESYANGNNYNETICEEFNPKNGSQAPEFRLLTLEGKEVKLSDFQGKIVLLDFWATWCPPCRKAIPDLVSIQREFKNDVRVIGISFDLSSTQGELESFIENYGINYPVLLGTIDVAVAYGNIQAIPTTFIIDREGIITNKHIGLVPKSDLIQEIKLLINKD
jgi:thiol-disulfide isomerase/thioredoxin